MKTCPKCLLKKEDDNFGKSSKHKSGYQAVCKLCLNKRTALSYQKHKEKRKAKVREYYRKNIKERSEYSAKRYAKLKEAGERGEYIDIESKECHKCKDTKNIGFFGKRTASKDGHDNICSECRKARDKAFYYANHEKSKAKSLRYQRENRGKAYISKKKFRDANDVSGWDLYKWANAVKARDNNECQSCGSVEDLEAHHLKPKAKFPELMLDMENGITYCQDCHGGAHRGSECNI